MSYISNCVPAMKNTRPVETSGSTNRVPKVLGGNAKLPTTRDRSGSITFPLLD
jgi:hypothetical protein